MKPYARARRRLRRLDESWKFGTQRSLGHCKGHRRMLDAHYLSIRRYDSRPTRGPSLPQSMTSFKPTGQKDLTLSGTTITTSTTTTDTPNDNTDEGRRSDTPMACQSADSRSHISECWLALVGFASFIIAMHWLMQAVAKDRGRSKVENFSQTRRCFCITEAQKSVCQ
jgi:hypothetical protein